MKVHEQSMRLNFAQPAEHRLTDGKNCRYCQCRSILHHAQRSFFSKETMCVFNKITNAGCWVSLRLVFGSIVDDMKLKPLFHSIFYVFFTHSLNIFLNFQCLCVRFFDSISIVVNFDLWRRLKKSQHSCLLKKCIFMYMSIPVGDKRGKQLYCPELAN